jgi:hypothetical protein
MACAKCDDKGAYGVEEPEEKRQMADGSTWVFGPTYSTVLCDCRKDVPPRDGKASWWTLESVYDADVVIPIGDESVSVKVSAEVPMSDDNYRLHRFGNRYYPTLIDVEVSHDKLTLHSDTARELAKALMAAADSADRIDNPDLDTCGHWAPCECS